MVEIRTVERVRDWIAWRLDRRRDSDYVTGRTEAEAVLALLQGQERYWEVGTPHPV